MNFEEMLAKFNMNLNKNQINLFNLYADFLMEYNQKVNLTAIKDRDGIFEKHFLDSLVVANFVKISGKLIDVGTGAGFPGVPLKILEPNSNLVLLESVHKKCEFLRQILFKLDIKAEIICDRAEKIARTNLRETFDFCTARAVANLGVLCEICLPLVKKGGIFIAMKGKDYKEELDNFNNFITEVGGKVVQINEFLLPLEQSNRAIICIEKVKNTPKSFPRNNVKMFHVKH